MTTVTLRELNGTTGTYWTHTQPRKGTRLSNRLVFAAGLLLGALIGAILL